MMIVSAAHAQYWRSSVQELPAGNIIVQPTDRGTAIGILLPVLAILERDPHARLLILPSDHYVANEGVLASSIRTASDAIRHHRRGVALLGMEADEPDPELGYIVAEAAQHAAFHDVRRFVEKPTLEKARRLCGDGALWNSVVLRASSSSTGRAVQTPLRSCKESSREIAPNSPTRTARCRGWTSHARSPQDRKIGSLSCLFLTVAGTTLAHRNVWRRRWCATRNC
jgi:mannose-1-phosphate guanylyltransferase